MITIALRWNVTSCLFLSFATISASLLLSADSAVLYLILQCHPLFVVATQAQMTHHWLRKLRCSLFYGGGEIPCLAKTHCFSWQSAKYIVHGVQRQSLVLN